MAGDAHWMARAIRLAERGLYGTSPNPRVGCVLVRDGAVVGEGWHRRAGGPHAEVLALQAAGPNARGATVYVSLEPCAHQGRTGPCSQALIEAGVARVLYAVPDEGAGQGGAVALEQAGIPCDGGLLEAEARALNPGYHRRLRGGRPWVRLKWAQSLDGRSALADGRSQWITAAPARRDGQRWRARSCAVLTGIGTVLADDPQLNVRLPGCERQPLRVVLDSALQTPASARIRGAGCLILHARPEAPEGVAVPRTDHGLDLAACLDVLAAHGCQEILIEAGPRLNAAFLRAGLVDELIIYTAPSLLGDGRPAAALGSLPGLDARLGLTVIDYRRIGQDSRIMARLGGGL